MGRCIVYTIIRLLLLICPFIFHFSFSPIFEHDFVTLFSGAVGPRRFKFVTHMENRWLYRVYWNQAAAHIRPFIFSFFFLSNFQTLKVFVTLFSGTVRPRSWNFVYMWTVGRCIVFTEIRLLLHILSLYSFFFLSNFQTLKVFVTLFSDEFFGTLFSAGWLGCAMLLGSFHCWGILLLLHIVGQGPAVLAAGAGWVGYSFYIF